MSAADESKPVSVDVDIKDGRTTIEVTGTRDAATVVRSESGERVYLPPETGGGGGGANPYSPTGGDAEGREGDNPYSGIPSSSPYTPTRQEPASVGQIAMPNGFRILHPEPVTDVRLLRKP